jgi:DNA-binding GntR family transcriptional regulator
MLEKNALSELVYDRLKQMIIDGVLLPGQKINKKELCEMLDVSQTPINEAISRMTGEGLIEQKSRQGFFIKSFSYTDLKELYAVRAGLEGISVRIVAEQASDEEIENIVKAFSEFSLPVEGKAVKKYEKADRFFHEQILKLSGNSVIIDFTHNFAFIIKSYQKGLIRQPNDTLEEHQEICRALRNREGEKAQRLIIEHHMKSREIIKHDHLRYSSKYV